MRTHTKLTRALAALAVAAAIATPAANAAPSVNPVVTCDPSQVPPPPSSIAASAAKDYAVLRACHGGSESTAFAAPSVARKSSAPTGFDWVSATIGAIAVAGLSLAFAAALGVRRRTGRHAVTAG